MPNLTSAPRGVVRGHQPLATFLKDDQLLMIVNKVKKIKIKTNNNKKKCHAVVCDTCLGAVEVGIGES